MDEKTDRGSFSDVFILQRSITQWSGLLYKFHMKPFQPGKVTALICRFDTGKKPKPSAPVWQHSTGFITNLLLSGAARTFRLRSHTRISRSRHRRTTRSRVEALSCESQWTHTDAHTQMRARPSLAAGWMPHARFQHLGLSTHLSQS